MGKTRFSGATRQGFTLVEALVAIGVFAVGMAAVAPLAITNVRGNSNAVVRTRAVTLAQEKIEEYRATTFSDLPAIGFVGGPETLESIYSRSWEIVAVPSTPTPSQAVSGDGSDLRRIRVVVSWTLPETAGSVTMATSKTRY